MKVDPLDVLSVAFPFAELDDEFQEDDDVEDGVQVDEEEEEEERIVDKEVSESGRENRKREDAENEQFQVRKQFYCNIRFSFLLILYFVFEGSS